MHIRPLKQYLVHGMLGASIALALPWLVVLTIVEDWARGKPLNKAAGDVVKTLIKERYGLLDDFTDLSYMDRGEYIEL